MNFRTLSQVTQLAALGLGSVVAWLWLFYGGPLSFWWRREFVYAALTAVIIVLVALSFARARGPASNMHALIETGVKVLTCVAAAGMAYVVAAEILTKLFV